MEYIPHWESIYDMMNKPASYHMYCTLYEISTPVMEWAVLRNLKAFLLFMLPYMKHQPRDFSTIQGSKSLINIKLESNWNVQLVLSAEALAVHRNLTLEHYSQLVERP